MLLKAPSLGCSPTDEVCLCQNVNFQNGVRDCVVQSCPAGTNTTEIITYGLAVCDAGEDSRLYFPNSKRGPQTKLTPLTALANATAITTSAILTTITSG